MPTTIQIAVRYSDEEVERIDALIEKMQELPEYGGIRLTRAVIAKMAALDGIEHLEQWLDAREAMQFE